MRMGSCGTVRIQYRVYFKDEELYRKEVIESPFECYRDQVNEDEVLEDLVFWMEIISLLN